MQHNAKVLSTECYFLLFGLLVFSHLLRNSTSSGAFWLKHWCVTAPKNSYRISVAFKETFFKSNHLLLHHLVSNTRLASFSVFVKQMSLLEGERFRPNPVGTQLYAILILQYGSKVTCNSRWLDRILIKLMTITEVK